MSQRSFDRQARRRQQDANRRRAVRNRRAGLAAGAVGAAVLLAPSAANAADISVTSAGDSGPGTLRAAVATANGNSAADTITFQLPAGQDLIKLTTGQLGITESQPLTITGPGDGADADTEPDLTISGDDKSRIFQVNGGTSLSISGLKLTDGNGRAATNPPPPPPVDEEEEEEEEGNDLRTALPRATPFPGTGGGAITSSGDLTITDSLITGNTVNDSGSNGYAPGGGILVTGGQTTVQGSTVSDNRATAAAASGGGIANVSGTLSVRDSFVSDNEVDGEDEYGGGITAIGNTTIDNTQVTGNEAKFGLGGGIATNDAKYDEDKSGCGPIPVEICPLGAAGVPAARGVQAATKLTVSDSTIANNSAQTGGGIGSDFEKDPDSNKYIATTGSVTIVRTTIDDNTASRQGGGIYVTNQEQANEYTVRESTVSNNRVEPDGRLRGGDSAGELTGSGGGIEVEDASGPTLISNSTVSGNGASRGGGIHGGDLPRPTLTRNSNVPSGVVRAEDLKQEVPTPRGQTTGTETTPTETETTPTETETTPTETETTPTETETTPEPGGPGTGSLVIANSTVASNEADSDGGGAGVAIDQDTTDGADPQLKSTIVADNFVTEEEEPQEEVSDRAARATTANDTATSDSEGLDLEYSLIETPGSATLNPDPSKPSILNQDPQLGALADNGGTTDTHLPAESSPAIDKGTANGLTIEQRLTARTLQRPPADAADGTDIGAVELPAPTTSTTPGQPGRPVTPSSTPAICGRRAISLIRADRRGSKVKLTGLVGTALYGKTVTIQTDPKGAKASAFTKTTTVKASRTGSFTASVPAPKREDFITVRYRAKAGSSTSPALKLPQRLTSKSVKSAKGTLTVTGKVKKSVLGKRNKVKIRRLVCGRYRTVGSARPDADGNYKITFKSTNLRGVSLYRAEVKVLLRPGSKKYVIQYARAIAVKTTSQTG